MSEILELRLLGVPDIRQGDENLNQFRTRKVLALIAFLACSGKVHSRAELADLLWDERSSARASANLRTLLTRTKRVFGAWLSIDRETVAMVEGTSWHLDVSEFRKALVEVGTTLSQGRRLNRTQAARLQAAVDLYRGDFMDGFSVGDARVFDEWLFLQREALHRDARNALVLLADYHLSIRAYGQGIDAATRLLALDSLDESAQRRLIALLALGGQPQAALEQYQSCARILATELGIEPDPATTALAERIRHGDLKPLDPQADNPYKGLAAFSVGDAEDFHGRETFLKRLSENLEHLPLTMMIGASGSGKTSVIRAQMATYQQTQPEQPSPWLVAALRPGPDPFQALAEQLVTLIEPNLLGDTAMLPLWTQELREELEAGEISLVDVAARIPSLSLGQEGQTGGLLLIVDQFEELFSLCDDPDVSHRFIDLLLSAVYEPLTPPSDSDSNTHLTPAVTLLLALRADFTAQVLSHGSLTTAIQHGSLILGPMSPSELRRAVEEPARSRGVSFEPGLVSRLLADVGDESGNLPLLQFVLRELWMQQEHMQLTHAAYEASGSVAGALRRHAEGIYLDLDATMQERARRVFSQLVHPLEDAGATRRAVLYSEFSDEDQHILQLLTDSRLVVMARNSRGQATVELVHEALIVHWPRLQEWTEVDRDFDLWRQRMRTSMHQWQRNAEREEAFLHGFALDEANYWYNAREYDLSEAECAYIVNSMAVRNRSQRLREDTRLEALAQAQALADSEHQRAVAANRERSRLRAMVAVITILALGLSIVAIFGFTQNNAAQRFADEAAASADLAQSHNLTTNAQLALKDDNTDLALALAQAANQIDDVPPQAQLMLADAAYRPGTRLIFSGHEGPVQDVDISGDDQFALSAGVDGKLLLWDLTSGELLKHITELSIPIESVAINADNDLALSGSADGSILRWSLPAGENTGNLRGHDEAVHALAFSPDGTQALSASSDDTLILWDVVNEDALVQLQGHQDDVLAVAFSPNGLQALSGSADSSVILWDLTSGDIIHRYSGEIDTFSAATDPTTGHAGTVTGVGFSPDGKLGFSAGSDRLVIQYDLVSGTVLGRFDLFGEGIYSMTTSPAGDRLLAGLLDGRVVVQDLVTFYADGNEEGVRWRMRGHSDRVQALAVTTDGSQALSASGDGTLRFWDIQNGAELLRLSDIFYGSSVAVSADGKTCLTSMWTGTIRVWDCATGALIQDLAGHEQMLFAGAYFTPDGKRIVSASGDVFSMSTDNSVRVWDVESGAELHRFDEHSERVWDLAVSPDGRYAASGSHDGTLRLWDLQDYTGRILNDFGPQAVRSVAFSPDGKAILIGLAKGKADAPDYALRMIDISSGEELRRFEGHSSVVADVAFSPDGKLALSGSVNQAVLLWDVASGQLLKRLVGHSGSLTSVTFSHDGQLAASAGTDETVFVWDVASGQAIRRFEGHSGIVLEVVFFPDGERLLSTADDDTVRVWRLDLEEVALQTWIAANRYVPELTPEQRVLFNISD